MLACPWFLRGRTGFKLAVIFLVAVNIFTAALYYHRDIYAIIEEEVRFQKIPDVPSFILSKFPNETYWGSVRRQQTALKNIGLEYSPKLVIYNRVPKCGSTTTLDIIRFLKKKLKFNVFNDIAPKMKHNTDSEEEEMSLVKNITRFKRPMLYIRHIYFLEFDKFGYRSPVYINIVRDPVDLFISNYYYLRYGFSKVKNGTNAQSWKREMTDEKRDMSIDECTDTENLECARPYSNLIPFFCGSSNICLKRNDEALEIAKTNVRQHYTIVGIMEDFPNTMKAFETLIPKFFMGAGVLYSRANHALHENSKTAHRKEPEKETIEYLKKGLWREYQLYNFIKELFYNKVEFMKTNNIWD